MGKKGAQRLDRNPNWKGGITIASNGYILVKAPKHPDADSRGYVYEHRLVAERMLGRPLRQGEQVHHKDGNKTNNSESNLHTVQTVLEHRFLHRAANSNRRLPGEDNPIINCACSCGNTLAKYDDYRRPRIYINGHNPHKRETVDAIISALSNGPMTTDGLTKACGKTNCSIKTCLNKLKTRGIARQVRRGLWCIAEQISN